MYCVYKHTTPSNKVYIGITGQNPLKRWGGGCNYKNQKHFYSAILKYGWDNIKHEILFDNLTKGKACEIEKRLIAEYKATDRRYGYNESSGGESGAAGVIVSAETRHKLSEARKGEKNHNYGKHLSAETKRKLSVLNKERFKHEKHWNLGNKYSEEQRKKLSIAHKNCNQNYFTKKVICVETQVVYNSMCEAAKAINRSQGNITTSAKTGCKCGGFHWKYYNEGNKADEPN